MSNPIIPWWNHYPVVNNEQINLDWILKKIQEFNTRLDEWSTLAAELQAGLADINTMKAAITAIQADIADLDAIRAAISGLSTEDAHLQQQIDEIKQFIDSYESSIEALRSYIDGKIAIVNKRIDTLSFDILNDTNVKIIKLQKQLDTLSDQVDSIDTSVLNPWHWGLGRIDQDKNINFIYNDLADECLTTEQYCKLGLSAADYASFDLTARDYAEFGKTKLHFRWVYSPFEGFKQDINVVLSNIANWIFGTMSAEDYASLDLTADEYADMDLTSVLYLMMNNNGTLTADDYAALGSLNNGLTFNYNFI